MSGFDGFIARLHASPFYRHMGLHAESRAPGSARVTMRFRDELVQMFGDIHGGALLAAADAAVNVALASTLGPDERCATVELSMQFHKPAGKNDVVADGTVTKKGGRIGFIDCVLTAGGEEIGRASAVCYIKRPSAS